MMVPFTFMGTAPGGETPITVDSIQWAVPAAPYTCAGSPVGLLPWGPTTGLGRYEIWVLYSGGPAWDEGEVTLTAAITSLTASGGSVEPATDGSLSAISFLSAGAYIATNRAIYEVTYSSPAKPGAGGSFQTAALVLSLLNAAVEVDVLNDSCQGDFACS